MLYSVYSIHILNHGCNIAIGRAAEDCLGLTIVKSIINILMY